MNLHEEGKQLQLDFTKLKKVAQIDADIVPVVVQNADTGDVLILAYVNDKALNYTLKHKVATFWSTSRNELWIKGKTSGDTLQLVEVRVNCDQNSLLYRVKPAEENACHTNRTTCYYRKINGQGLEFIHE